MPYVAPREGSRLASLDVLRALAVVLVLGRHVEPTLEGWHPAAEAVMRVWIRGGWIGVDLFFVLSGFLVSGLLFAEHQSTGKVGVLRFLVRRGFKIYPPFYVLLVATVAVLAYRVGAAKMPWKALLHEALFVQNYLHGVWWHTWSLAIEEHFYLLCAALVWWLVWRKPGAEDPFDALPPVFAAVAAGALAARVHAVLAHPIFDGGVTHIFPTHLRVDGLFFGVVLSYLHHRHRAWLEGLVRPRPWLALAGAALAVPAFVLNVETSWFLQTVGFALLYVGAGLIVVTAVVVGLPNHRLVRAAGFLGAHSYSIYLWHLMVYIEVQRAFVLYLGASPRSMTAVGVYFVAALGIGVAMAKLVEMPALALRDRLVPRPRPGRKVTQVRLEQEQSDTQRAPGG